MTTRRKWIKIDTRYVNEIHVRPTEGVICWTKTTGPNNESYWATWSLGSPEWLSCARGSRTIPPDVANSDKKDSGDGSEHGDGSAAPGAKRVHRDDDHRDENDDDKQRKVPEP